MCGAGFRGMEICQRCGTDLKQLMRLASRAWSLREKSRASLITGNLAVAMSYEAQAHQILRRR